MLLATDYLNSEYTRMYILTERSQNEDMKIKTYISKSLWMTRFWNNLYTHSQRKPNDIKVLKSS